MPLTQASLQAKIVAELVALGSNPNGEHSWVNRFASAIAKAVVDEIQQNSQVIVPGGGSYPGSVTKVT